MRGVWEWDRRRRAYRRGGPGSCSMTRSCVEGIHVYKKDIVGVEANPEYEMTLDKYMSVSTMSIRFYIVAKRKGWEKIV